MSDVPDWQGIAFDMDGTLVDTEHVHFDAWNEVFGRFDVGPFEQQWCAAFPLHLLSKRLKRSCAGSSSGSGARLRASAPRWWPVRRRAAALCPALRARLIDLLWVWTEYPSITVSADELVAQKEAAFTALARDPDGPVAQAVFASLDGAVQALAEKGVPIAVCTSSFRESAAAVLAGTGLARLFPEERRTTFDDVENAKPDAEPYLRAAGTLGLPPSAMVAIEDSASGVGSAVAAGYGVVLAVLTTSAEEVLLAAGAHRTFDSTVDAIRWLTGATGAASRARL